MQSDQADQLTDYIQPFEVKVAIAGLELEDTDGVVLDYLNFLLDVIPIHKMYFLHFMEPLKLFESLYNEGYLELMQHDAMTAATREQMQKSVDEALRTKVKDEYIVDARMGNPLSELLANATELEADLTIIGQKADQRNHSILARKFARKVNCNALLVPENSKMQLKRILVPVDYSPNSIKAIQTAISINLQLPEPVPITCLSVFEVPPVNWYRIQRTQEQMKEMMEEDRRAAFDALAKKYFPIQSGNVQLEMIEKLRPGIGKYIMDYATENQYDLIVMGAKGHSTLDAVLMGSVTEKVASLTESIPVLIVR